MQVAKLTADQMGAAPKKHQYTEEEMRREYNYILAEKLTKTLLDKSLISVDEFNKISERNGFTAVNMLFPALCIVQSVVTFLSTCSRRKYSDGACF